MTRGSFAGGVAAALIYFGVCGLASTALALPKQGTGTKCDCLCSAPSGESPSGYAVGYNTYDPHGLPCSALQGATCNLTNPSTGGVATGTVQACYTSGTNWRGGIILQNGTKLPPVRFHR